MTNKINGLIASGFTVILMVVGVSEKRSMNVPVYYQPILAPNGLKRWLHTIWLIKRSLFNYPQRSIRLLKEAEKAGYKGFGKWRMLAVLSNFLKVRTDWVHFAYGTMAVERAFIGRVLGAKVSMSLRGYDIAIAPLMNKGMYANVWPYLDKVHSISNDLIEVARKHGMPDTLAFEVIPPAIDAEKFTSPDGRLWNAKPHFLTVARLHWKKGLEYTLEALAMLDVDFSYTIIGEGPERERLLFAAYQLGIADKVHFVGRKDQDAIIDAMHAHDIYLQYSIQEGFCNAVLEAQAAGMLCIVSDAEGLAENVQHLKTGWVVEKRNAKLLTQTIQLVNHLSNEERNTISKAAKKRVVDIFTLSKQREQFMQFYQ